MDELEEQKLLNLLKKSIDKVDREKIREALNGSILGEQINEVLYPNFKISIETTEDSKSHTIKVGGTNLGISIGLSYLINDLLENKVLSKDEMIRAIKIGLGDKEKWI